MTEKESPIIQNLSDSFDEMFETAEAVKGESFAKFVGFLVNSQSMVKVISMACEESIDEGKYVLEDSDHPLRKTIARILNQGIHMYSEALELSEKEIEEAASFAHKMLEKIDKAEDSLSQEGDK